jgi:hypothetical protein
MSLLRMEITALTPATAEGTFDILELEGNDAAAKTVALNGLLRTD